MRGQKEMVSNVASRLCNEAKPGQFFISPRVLMAVEDTSKPRPFLRCLSTSGCGGKDVVGRDGSADALKFKLPNRLDRITAAPQRVHDAVFLGYLYADAGIVTRVRRNAADCGLARKARHVRVRAALC